MQSHMKRFSFVAWGITGDEIETGTRFFSAFWSKNKRLRGQGLWGGGGGKEWKEWAEATGGQNIITNHSNFSGAGRKGGKEKGEWDGIEWCKGRWKLKALNKVMVLPGDGSESLTTSSSTVSMGVKEEQVWDSVQDISHPKSYHFRFQCRTWEVGLV